MRDDLGSRGFLRAALASALAAGLLAAAPPDARAVITQIQVQYRQSEQKERTLLPDGSFYDHDIVSQYWSQGLILREAYRLPKMWTLGADLRWTDQYYIGQAYRKQVPSGSLRFNHPYASLNVTYQPEAVKTTTPQLVQAGVTLVQAPVTTVSRRQELNFNGYAALPKLPRLDWTWTRQHQNPDVLTTEGTSVTRRLGLAHEFGPWYFRGGYGDLATGRGKSSVDPPIQRTWDFATGAGFAPRPRVNFGVAYDLNGVRRGTGAANIGSLTQGASVSGAYRASPVSDWTLGYSHRRSEFRAGVRSLSIDNSGALTYGYRPIPGAQLSGSAGVRSLGSGAHNEVVRYLSGTGQYDGKVRRGWSIGALASMASNWEPNHPQSLANNFGAHSSFLLRRDLLLTGDWAMATNSEPPSPESRVVINHSVGLVMTPLRGIGVTYAESRLRYGPQWNQAALVTRGRSLEMHWTPSPRFSLGATLGDAGPPERDADRSSTQQYDMRWNAGSSFQVTGVYARSDSETKGPVGVTVQGRESYAGRVSAALARSITLNTGFTVAEPGTSSESRQFDASVLKTFGR